MLIRSLKVLILLISPCLTLAATENSPGQNEAYVSISLPIEMLTATPKTTMGSSKMSLAEREPSLPLPSISEVRSISLGDSPSLSQISDFKRLEKYAEPVPAERFQTLTGTTLTGALFFAQ